MLVAIVLLLFFTSSYQVQLLSQMQQFNQCTVDVGSLSEVNTNFGWVNGIYDIGQGIVTGLQGPLSSTYLEVLVKVYNNGFTTIVSNDVITIFREQAGAIVLLVIGALFVVAFPVTGFAFCCCRMCGRCGASKKHRPSKCALIAYLLTLFVALCFIVVAAGVYGVAVQNTSSNLDNLGPTTNNIVNDVQRVLTAGSDDVSCHLNSSIALLFQNLKAVVHALPNSTFETFEVNYGYNTMKEIINSSDAILQDFSSASEAITNALNQVQKLKANSVAAVQEIAQIKNELNAAKTALPTIKNSYQKIYNDVSLTFTTVDRTINETKSKVDVALGQADGTLDSVQQSIMGLTGNINTTVSDIIVQINAVNEKVQWIEKEVKEFPQKNALVSGVKAIVVIPSVLLLVPALIALTCGLIRLPQNDKRPSQRPRCFAIGGFMAMTAVAIGFVFGWLIMAVADVAFVGGYSMELVCKPLFNDVHMQLFSMIPDFSFQIPDIFGDGSTVTDIGMGDILNSCKYGDSIFKALKGDQLMNVTAIMNKANLKQYRDEAIQKLSQYPLDYTFNTTELNALEYAVDMLEQKWGTFDPTLNAVRAAGGNPATLVNSAEQSLRTVDIAVKNLINIANATVGEVRQVVEGAYKSGNFTAVGTKLIDEAFNSTVTNITEQVTVTKDTLLAQTFDCRPVYDIWQNIGLMLCGMVGRPVQGIWASAGLIAICFCVAILFLILISKYLYRMDPIYDKEKEFNFSGYNVKKNSSVAYQNGSTYPNSSQRIYPEL